MQRKKLLHVGILYIYIYIYQWYVGMSLCVAVSLLLIILHACVRHGQKFRGIEN